MELRNFIYLSSNKIDLLYPQISRILNDSKLTGGLNIGIFKAEFAKDFKGYDTINKLKSIISFLDKNKQIGTASSPRKYFRGSLKAKIIKGEQGSAIISGVTDNGVCVSLCCSTANLTINEAVRPKNNDSSEERSFSNSDGSDFYMPSSVSISYLNKLREIFVKERELAESEYDFNCEREKRCAQLRSNRLSTEEMIIINKKAFFNAFLQKQANNDASRKLKKYTLEKLLRFLIDLIIGKDLAIKKVDAFSRNLELEKVLQEIQQLPVEDQLLLDFSKRLIYTEGRVQKLEFVAITMVTGTSNGEKVVIGSPLFVAETFL